MFNGIDMTLQTYMHFFMDSYVCEIWSGHTIVHAITHVIVWVIDAFKYFMSQNGEYMYTQSNSP